MAVKLTTGEEEYRIKEKPKEPSNQNLAQTRTQLLKEVKLKILKMYQNTNLQQQPPTKTPTYPEIMYETM